MAFHPTTSTTTYLITGANRGIGRGLADILLRRPNTTLIALVRDPSHPTSLSLQSNPSGAPGTRVIMLPYEGTSPTAALSAITTLQTQHAISRIDVVIANAGAILSRGPVATLTPEEIAAHMAINCTAPVLLLQATLPLLREARKAKEAQEGYEAKFIAVSSAIGSTGMIDRHLHASTPAYGASKAAMNHVMRKAFFEVGEDVDIEMMTPGPVKTDLTRMFDMSQAPRELVERMLKVMQPLDRVCEGLMRNIDGASRKTTGGGFRDWKNDVFEW